MLHRAALVMLGGCSFTGSSTTIADAPMQHGAITFDVQSSASIANSAVLTWSHTTGDLTNGMLVVGASIEKQSTAAVASVLYSDLPLTKAVAARGGGGVDAELWFLLAPPAGAHEIVMAFTLPVTGDGAVGGAISLAGVNQMTPIAMTATGGSQGIPSTAITTTVDGSWVVDAIMVDNGDAATPQAPQVNRWNAAQGTKIRGAGSTLPTLTHGPVTMSWSASSDNWAQAVAELSP